MRGDGGFVRLLHEDDQVAVGHGGKAGEPAAGVFGVSCGYGVGVIVIGQKDVATASQHFRGEWHGRLAARKAGVNEDHVFRWAGRFAWSNQDRFPAIVVQAAEAERGIRGHCCSEHPDWTFSAIGTEWHTHGQLVEPIIFRSKDL